MYLHFFYDKVEIVPACVGEESRVKWESNDCDILLCVLPGEELCPPLAQLQEPSAADDDQGQELSIGEVILNLYKSDYL